MLLLAVAATLAGGQPSQAKGPDTLPSSVKLEQWETKPHGDWTTGGLNANNSDYFEGEVVPFQLEIPSTVAAGSYAVAVCRNYEDGDHRGYLFLAPFNTSRAATPGGTITSTNGAFSAVNATIDAVAETGGQGSCKAGDRETVVTITKSAGDAYVLWGGHLASPEDPGVGDGNGAASWPGASLHMKLSTPSKDVAIQTCATAPTPTSGATLTSTPGTPGTASPSSTGTSTAEASATSTTQPETATPEPSGTATPSDTATPQLSATPLSPSATAPPVAVRSSTPTVTSTAAPTNTPAPTVAPTLATATPTRVSQPAGAVQRPRQLPASGCGSDAGSDSSTTWLVIAVVSLSAAVVALAVAGGTIWRRGGHA